MCLLCVSLFSFSIDGHHLLAVMCQLTMFRCKKCVVWTEHFLSLPHVSTFRLHNYLHTFYSNFKVNSTRCGRTLYTVCCVHTYLNLHSKYLTIIIIITIKSTQFGNLCVRFHINCIQRSTDGACIQCQVKLFSCEHKNRKTKAKYIFEMVE